MTFFTINEARIDYFTITSSCNQWYKKANEVCELVSENWETRQRWNYTGKARNNLAGNIFLGDGLQDGSVHYMLQIDGALADDLKHHVLSFHPSYFVKCTRVDFQVTIPMPEKWSQWNLLNRLKKRYGEQMVGYPRPNTGKGGKILQTVYLGRREGSDRFLRVYAKQAENGEVFLRLETELKRGRSNVVYREMCQNQWDSDLTEIMNTELKYQSQKDYLLNRTFAKYLEGYVKPLAVRSESGKTGDWIVDVVIPVLSRHLSEHGSARKPEIENMVMMLADQIFRQEEQAQ